MDDVVYNKEGKLTLFDYSGGDLQMDSGPRRSFKYEFKIGIKTDTSRSNGIKIKNILM